MAEELTGEFFVTINSGDDGGYSGGYVIYHAEKTFTFEECGIEDIPAYPDGDIWVSSLTPYDDKNDTKIQFYRDAKTIKIDIYVVLPNTDYRVGINGKYIKKEEPEEPEPPEPPEPPILIKTYDDNTIILGTGDKNSRTNEITGDLLAVFRNYVIGYKDGVLNIEDHNFNYEINGNILKLTDGMCFAYGYFGYVGEKEFTILPPAVEQYYVVYAKIDKSVVPNGCDVFIKPNYASPNIGINAFRQDVLSTVKTGVYEIPLWIFKATNKGIDELSFDSEANKKLRASILRNSIYKTEYSDYTEKAVLLKLEDGVTATTQRITDNSKKIATTAFVQSAVQAEINK